MNEARTNLAASSSAVLTLEQWGVAFGEQVVLERIDLSVRAGELVVVVGPSGGGKSTLLRTLAGLNEAQPALRTTGDATYRGERIGVSRPAIVMQHARLVSATVRENLVCALPNRRAMMQVAQTERAHAVLEALGLMGLIPRFAEPAYALSTLEQRLLFVARAYASTEPLILLDEPTSSLAEGDADRMLEVLSRVARERALVVSLHHRGHARKLGGDTVLLAGGTVQERTPTEAFFTAPRTAPGRTYVETGSVALPRPGADPATLDAAYGGPEPSGSEALAELGTAEVNPAESSDATHDARSRSEAEAPAEAPPRTPRGSGPRNFYWSIPGRLGGTPRPGIVDDERHDLDALRDLGVTLVVCLEESSLEPRRFEAAGMRLVHAPIPDMRAPSLAWMRDLCARIDEALAADEVVAVHCLAGLGRTGTVLAAYAVHRGASALDAIERIRALRPRSIQTDDQLELVRSMERLLPIQAAENPNERTER